MNFDQFKLSPAKSAVLIEMGVLRPAQPHSYSLQELVSMVVYIADVKELSPPKYVEEKWKIDEIEGVKVLYNPEFLFDCIESVMKLGQVTCNELNIALKTNEKIF